MKVGSKHITYADLTLRSSFDNMKIVIDSECESNDKLIYCLECDAVILSSKENSHTKCHNKIYDLEQRLEELDAKK